MGSTFTIQYSHLRVVALGGGALGLAPAVTGALSGFSMGTIQTAYANAIYGRPWYEGVTQSGFVGVAGGMAAGYVMGKVMPRLPGKGAAAVVSRMAVGGLVGGGVSGGTQVAINVATERPWDEGLGPAINVGWTTGSLGAFMDYYGGRLMDRQLGRRPVRSLAEDADVRPSRPGLADTADMDPTVRRALQI